MPVSGSNAAIQLALDAIQQKIDNLSSSLPQTYVTIRNHDLQIKAHEEKLHDALNRITAIEKWRIDGTEWANDEHENMRKEWGKELKEVKGGLDSLERTVLRLVEQFGWLIKIMAWLLGIISVVIAALIVAWITHIIH